MKIHVIISYRTIKTNQHDEVEFTIDTTEPDAAFRAMKRNWPVTSDKLEHNMQEVTEVELAIGDELVLFSGGNIFHLTGPNKQQIGTYDHHMQYDSKTARAPTLTDALYGELLTWLHGITHQRRIDSIMPKEPGPLSFIIDTGPVARGTQKNQSNWRA